MDQAGTKGTTRTRWPREIAIRNAVDLWGRERWRQARVCHELVLNRGSSRLDVAFVSPWHLAVVEIKSGYDTMERAIHQAAMARLSACEVWLICDARYDDDMRLIRYLLPSLGIARAIGSGSALRHVAGEILSIEVLEEADASKPPHAEALLNILWVAELHAEATRHRVWMTKAGTHKALVAAMMNLSLDEQIASVCRQLRARDALWRADPPIGEAVRRIVPDRA